MAKQWNRLSKEAVKYSFFELFKIHLKKDYEQASLVLMLVLL